VKHGAQWKTMVAAAALATVLSGCGPAQPPVETTAAPDLAAAATASLLSLTGSAPLAASDPADGPALTMTRTVHEGAEGQDPHVIVRLEAAVDRYVELHEANHTPYDVAAQTPGGALATAVGSGAATPVLYQVADAAGAPLVCGATAPASMALYEDDAGGLVLVGLTLAAFEGTESESGITIAPLPETAVCGRAVYTAAER
jgi:hypothetical protein